MDNSNEEKNFVEFRRKVQAAEVLSAAMEHLLKALQFSGRVSVILQNGRVLNRDMKGSSGSAQRDRNASKRWGWKDRRSGLRRGTSFR